MVFISHSQNTRNFEDTQQMEIIMNTGNLADNTISEEQAVTKELDMAAVTKILVACPSGVGSSAIGAGMLRKKIEKENLNITVANVAVRNLPSDAEIVITHQKLTEQAKLQAPNAHHISLSNFLDNKLYTSLVNSLKEAQQ